MHRFHRIRRPASHRTVLFAALFIVGFGIVSSSTRASSVRRPPTLSEVRALKAAIGGGQPGLQVLAISISTLDTSFATVTWSHPPVATTWVDLAHHLRGRWRFVWLAETAAPHDGACAYTSAGVVRDLLGVVCPPWSAVHGRPTNEPEARALTQAFWESALAQRYPARTRLDQTCISRLDRRWAAGRADLGSTSGVVWFERGRTWQVAYETVFRTGHRPGRRIVLSLASCVGYQAADYGA